MTRLASLALLVMLSACTSVTEQARESLPGMPVTDLMACAGSPESSILVGPDEWVGTYAPVTVSTPSVTGSVPVLGDIVKPTVTASASMSCKMVVRIKSGYVFSVHYIGASSLIMGPHTACIPMVLDCMRHPDKTQLPAGYVDLDYIKLGPNK